MTVLLSKLHGLGNDFLVHLSDDPSVLDDAGLWSRRARDWCRRHRGIGADGLIVGMCPAGGTDLVMLLHNADGSRAEMSGNGIRCLAHAAARSGQRSTGRLSIATDGGLRTVEYRADPGNDPATLISSVDMGAVKPGPEPDRPAQWPGSDAEPVPQDRVRFAVAPERMATFDLGNPHLVLLVDDPALVDIELAGRGHEAAYDGGMNVHVVAPTPGERDAMTMRTSERGVGPTEACGTGATAVALAAHQWGLATGLVTVHMPGGEVTVDVGDPLTLHGPSVHIADIEVAP